MLWSMFYSTNVLPYKCRDRESFRRIKSTSFLIKINLLELQVWYTHHKSGTWRRKQMSFPITAPSKTLERCNSIKNKQIKTHFRLLNVDCFNLIYYFYYWIKICSLYADYCLLPSWELLHYWWGIYMHITYNYIFFLSFLYISICSLLSKCE